LLASSVDAAELVSESPSAIDSNDVGSPAVSDWEATLKLGLYDLKRILKMRERGLTWAQVFAFYRGRGRLNLRMQFDALLLKHVGDLETLRKHQSWNEIAERCPGISKKSLRMYHVARRGHPQQIYLDSDEVKLVRQMRANGANWPEIAAKLPELTASYDSLRGYCTRQL
jgi:hypothetical protein